MALNWDICALYHLSIVITGVFDNKKCKLLFFYIIIIIIWIITFNNKRALIRNNDIRWNKWHNMKQLIEVVNMC